MQLFRYLLTAGAAAIIDIGGFAFLSAIHVPVMLAAACSFLMATVVNFFLSARWVFGAPANARGYRLFLSGAMFGALVNVTLTTVGVTSPDLPRIVAKMAAVAVTFMVNFWINALVVFRNKDRKFTSATARAVADRCSSKHPRV
jgi:putative flippase GtrA